MLFELAEHADDIDSALIVGGIQAVTRELADVVRDANGSRRAAVRTGVAFAIQSLP